MATLLTGILVLSGIAALLALFLEAADALLMDFGQCKIDINEGEKVLEVKGGKKLLETLSDQQIFIPSACGGRGSCGLCKVKAPSGAGPVLPTETPYLNPEDYKKHVRLSCQVRVREDISINIPSALFNVKRFKARVKKLKDQTDRIKEVDMELLEPAEINFKSGQFIQLEVPGYKGSPEPVQRAYSMASQASVKNTVKLFVGKVDNGIATTYVHDFLREGDEITFNGPFGDFYYRESEREMVLVCQGSGLAPIMSILNHMAEIRSQRRATLFFGGYIPQHLYYLDEIETLKKDIPNFHFVPVLAAPRPEDNWQGEVGWVTDPIPKFLEETAQREAYLCGGPAMIDASIKTLTKAGISEDRIYYDKF